MRSDSVQERLGDAGAVWNKIDYARDAIIEASAGTGKTYALQSIVLKLLAEGEVESVQNLLLVTYTEKAAGELKDRIRGILAEAECLTSDFDEMTICTIHSFCRQLLTEYAFENRVPMQAEICSSDRDLIRQSILAALRSEAFAEVCGGDYAEWMKLAGWSDTGKLVVDAVKRFDPYAEPDAIKPEAVKKKEQAQAFLSASLVRIAKEHYWTLKEQSARMAFDDLVVRAHEAIGAEAEREQRGETSELLESIRRKYRIALVDEFQDTDSRQWDIFRRLFSHRVNRIDKGPKPLQGSLIVVGDPKQAIYSFRGADIGTYLRAKASITAAGEGQPPQTLGTTFRSTPKLVEAFNRIFGGKVGADRSWFEDMAEGETGRISYESVNPPPASGGKFHGIRYADEFGGPVDLLESLKRPLEAPCSRTSGNGNRDTCLPVFLRYAAREMKRLKALAPAYTTEDPNTQTDIPHRLNYGDMCILVRGNKEARTALEILAEAGIPAAFYKERGIYASEEAESLLALFDFLSAPSRRGRLEAVLLTPLFGFRPGQLAARLAGGDADFSRLVDRWQEAIVRRDWNHLFESIMDDTLLAHPLRGDFGFNRRWSATRQILDKLLEQKGRLALTINEFADALRAWRADDTRAGEEGTLRRKESQADCVQIMTMHASKGLEFLVVFVAWGFGKLAKEESAIHEEKRLLYVALTRAEHKLYLPWSQFAQHTRAKTVKKQVVEVDEVGIGSLGSALLIPGAPTASAGFLARGIRACFGGDEAARANVVATRERLERWGGATRPDAAPTSPDVESTGSVCGATIPIYRFDAEELRSLRLQDDSYSSLHDRTAKRVATPDVETVEDETEAASALRPARGPTLLPRNNVSGDVFHDLMETLCKTDDSAGPTGALGFQSVGRADLADVTGASSPFLELVRRIMRRHALENQLKDGESTARTLARMAWRALNVPIRIGDAQFRLREIAFKDRLAELGFVVNRNLAFGEAVESDDTFNGKIDLLIRPKGAGGPVYVLDWKTNSLADYTAESTQAAMDENDYHLQYRFYALAVRRWLAGSELGGVAYLFVRAGEQAACVLGETGVFVATAESVTAASCAEAIKGVL
ncbi:MAG: UvrD-helicase domain-containing protein [Kiritimatiellia bacterium]